MVEKLAKLQKYLTEPPRLTPRDGIKYWQDRILFTLLMLGVSLGLIAYIPSIVLSVIEELWLIVLVDTFVYGWAVWLLFKRSLPFEIRAYSIILISYLLGIVLLLTVGPFGAGPVWLFFFPIITGLLLNSRLTVISLLINTVTVIILGIGLYYDILGWRRASGFPFESWVVIGVNFLLLNTLAAWAVVSVLNGLQNSLILEKKALEEIEEKNEALQNSNLKLIKVIDDRNRYERELLKSKEALAESELRFHDLVNILPLSYFLMDDDLNLIFLNLKMKELFQIPETMNLEADSLNALDLFISENLDIDLEEVSSQLKQPDPKWMRFSGSPLNGSPFPIEVMVSVIQIEERQVGIQGIVLDIRERLENEKIKKEKEIAEKTNEAISEWVSFIVHELRTPISGLIQFARLGMSKADDPQLKNTISDLESYLQSEMDKSIPDLVGYSEHYRDVKNLVEDRFTRFSKYFDRLYSSGQRLLKLTNELLDLSKLESGSSQFIMREANILQIVTEACNEMEADLSSQNIKLKISAKSDLPELKCDAFRIGQVLRNLLNNAVKFSFPESEINLGLTLMPGPDGNDEPDKLQFSITNHGRGIPLNETDLIFSKFKQGKKNKPNEGSGLGLPICKQIIAAHHGHMWVESEENRKTTFYFTLPYAS